MKWNKVNTVHINISLADEYSWNDVKKRSVWEKEFDSEYIQPILEVSM